MKRVDRAWLKEHNACADGFKFWCEHCEGKDTEQQLLTLVKHSDDWAYWILTKLLNTKQNQQLAVFSAQQVLPIFEKKYPTDKRPRLAIEAAKNVLKNDTKKNRAAAWAAAGAAWAAAWAATAARDAGAAGTTSAMKMKILRYGISLLHKGIPR